MRWRRRLLISSRRNGICDRLHLLPLRGYVLFPKDCRPRHSTMQIIIDAARLVHQSYSARLSRASCRHRLLRPTTTSSTRLKAVIKSSVTLVQPTHSALLESAERYEAYEFTSSRKLRVFGRLIHPICDSHQAATISNG
jgi:hypothetical protein